MTKQAYWKAPEWVSCPECGTTEVAVYADYDRQVAFDCMECDARFEPGSVEFVDPSNND